MCLPKIRDEWRVPARPGQRVEVDALGVVGVITGCDDGDHIGVRVPGIDSTVYVHPRDLTYLKGRP